MARVSCFIDGFNLYHSLVNNPRLSHLHKYKWLDLRKLCSAVTPKSDSVDDSYYFTAYAEWDLKKVIKHKLYVRALESTQIKPIFGQFRKKDRYCRFCKKTVSVVEEKQTDVNIAIKLLQEATKDNYDTALILSGDSDLIPAIEAVKSTFPNKRIGVVIPPARRAEALKETSHFHIKLKEKHLQTCQFPNVIQLGGAVIKKPNDWF